MSQNIFRFTLLHDSGDKVISEPEGWAKIKFTLERDKDFHSLIELIETPLVFYGSNGVYDGGMDYLDAMKLDDQVGVQIEISEDEGISWGLFFVGLIDMQSKQRIDARKLQFVITRNDLWARFKNRYDNSVDIQSSTDLDGNSLTPLPINTLNLTSQPIIKTTEYKGHTGDYNTLDNAYTATTTNITLFGHQTIGGVLTSEFMRVLVKDQTDQKENGSYNASSSAWTRTTDGNTGAELENAIIQIDSGTYAGLSFKQYTSSPTIGVSNIDFQQYNYVDDFEVYSHTGSLPNITFYAQGQPQDSSINEIEFSYHYPFLGVDSQTDIFNIIELDQDFGTLTAIYNVLGQFTIDVISIDPDVTDLDWAITLFIQKNNETPIEIDHHYETNPVNGGLNPAVYFNLTGTQDLELLPSDMVYSYIVVGVGLTGGDNINSFRIYGGYTDADVNFKLSSLTQDTTSETFFIHDVGGAVSDRITGIENSFYSEYLGSNATLYRQYDNNGCGWPFVLARGLQIRQYTLLEKPFSMSFKQWWEGANPIMNLGLTYDTIGASQVIRVEEKVYFYNDSPILYLDWVNNITESFDKDYIFNKIKVGYKKWQSEDILGIDDPQTNHEYATLFKTIGQGITIQSDFIAASLAIETTRRQVKTKSADYKFDDDTFIIAVNMSNPYLPELDENFTSISNLLNSDKRYNLTLTPARNLARWGNLLLGCLKDYLTSSFKFTQGEGNYDMVSDYDASKPGICFAILPDSLSEKQNILASTLLTNTDYLFQPILLDFKFPLSYTNYKLIRDNRTRAIAVSTTDGGHTICHIKRLEYDVINSLGTFTVWKK